MRRMKVIFFALLTPFLLFLVASTAHAYYTITPSKTSISLSTMGFELIDIKVNTDRYGEYTISYDIEDSAICKCQWGEWNDDDTIQLTITGMKGGKTNVNLCIIVDDAKLEDSEISIAVDVDGSAFRLIEGSKKYEISDVRLVKNDLVIYYEYTNAGSEPSIEGLFSEAYQNGIECERSYSYTENQTTKIKDGAHVLCSRSYSLHNSKDIVDITVRTSYVKNSKKITFYFDPITGVVMKNKEELLAYREANPTPEPTETPAPTPTPTPAPTEKPTPATITVEPDQSASLEAMFATKPGNEYEKISYGRWKNQYEYFTFTYEFFSDGSMTLTFGEEHSYDTIILPGLYKVSGTTLEIYLVGYDGEIDKMTVPVSYDGMNLILDGDIYTLEGVSNEAGYIEESIIEDTDQFRTVGNIVSFGHYEQDNNTDNGAEEIEWIVLDVQDNKCLLLSKYGLDARPFNSEWKSITWEQCTLRKWLNEDFLHTAFTGNEQTSIIVSNVDNSRVQNDSEADTLVGNDTHDKIYLLSRYEANQYFSDDNTRRCVPTAYAISNGADIFGANKVDGQSTARWWLRSSNAGNGVEAIVNEDGANNVGHIVFIDGICVRPVMWIDLGSGLFKQ